GDYAFCLFTAEIDFYLYVSLKAGCKLVWLDINMYHNITSKIFLILSSGKSVSRLRMSLISSICDCHQILAHLLRLSTLRAVMIVLVCNLTVLMLIYS